MQDGRLYLETCLCCGLPDHMLIKPTKKIVRYYAHCSHCRFALFVRKCDVPALRTHCSRKKDVLKYSRANKRLFDTSSFEFEDTMCMFCSKQIKVKKCACKDPEKRMVSFGCKDCLTRFFVPVAFLDFFYVC
ncbi:hypothetical protein [Candidatus Uabimicrobium amorphum]|uniref:Uncharacterized protein n=1 Tax=Uabimicrobium amorphum TaxID=2596890 RepID=A0A5S9ITG6_UABAM|nr:hypothetical protein [Candidatus Uabimicrobium amorphum]BBM86840.1 hypothetical protein UABAM_05237 [Candidatus Uabimicrobium amorphum]